MAEKTQVAKVAATDSDCRIREMYKAEVVPYLMKRFNYKNVNQVPKLVKITINGGLGDVKVKRFLIAILEEELAPIRERRKEWEAKIPEVYALLKQGCDNARAVAADTLADVRRAMKINYFEDAELIEEQARKFAQK